MPVKIRKFVNIRNCCTVRCFVLFVFQLVGEDLLEGETFINAWRKLFPQKKHKRGTESINKISHSSKKESPNRQRLAPPSRDARKQ